MIIEARNKEPFLHLGFNKQEINVYKNDNVIVWQESLYNNYDYDLAFSDAIIVNELINKLIIKYDSIGTYTGMITISDKEKTLAKESNLITINVIERTFGSLDIKFGDTDITFND